MRRMALAVAAAMVAVCARAEAAVYTETTGVSYSDTDGGYFAKTVFVPNFDSSLGTLVSTTFTLIGSASETLIYASQSSAPTSGSFNNDVTINGRLFAQPGTQITSAAGANGRLQNNFQVSASTTYDPTYTGANPSLDFTFAVQGGTLPYSAPVSAPISFTGTLTTAFTYTAVPEPISASLLLGLVLSFAALRRRVTR